MGEQPPTTSHERADSAPPDTPPRVAAHDNYEEEQHARKYISHLWAQDWDSTEDTAYDNFTSHP